MKRWILPLLGAALASASFTGAFAQSEPKDGGEYSFAITSGDPDTFDCHATNTIGALYRLAPHYSLLLKYNPANYPEIIGDVAEDWTVSDDGLTYTFDLRDNVTFHDGSKLTSADVKATYDRLRDPPEGVISVRQSQFRDIQSVEAPDDDTVVITLSQPNASMETIFAGPYNCIFSAEMLQSDPDYPARKVMGTGPFKFAEHRAGATWTAVKFDDYFLEGLPHVDKLVLRNMPPPAAVNAMSAGQVPGVFPSLSQADVDRISATRGDAVVKYDPIVTTVMFAVVFNTTRPPFDDVRVRQALNLAIDRRAGSTALSKIASASGFGTLMRPGSIWARDEAATEALPGFSSDMDARRAKARALLTEAGQENLSFTFLNWNRYTPLGVFLIDQWRQIGVSVTQEALDVAGYFGKQKAGDYTVSLDAIAEYSDDPTLRFAKLVSASKNPTNLTHGDDPAFDALYEEQARTLDKDKRVALARQMEDRLLEQAAYLPLFWSVRPMVVDAKVKGLLTPKIASNYVGLDQATIWIDE